MRCTKAKDIGIRGHRERLLVLMGRHKPEGHLQQAMLIILMRVQKQEKQRKL
jgi:hypothetical protein